MGNSRSSHSRNRRRGPNMTTDVIDTYSVAQRISDAIQRTVGHLSAPHKRYARMAGVDVRTARNHYEGQNCPRLPEAIRLIEQSDEAFFAVLKMANRMTPETAEKLLEIVTAPGGPDDEDN